MKTSPTLPALTLALALLACSSAHAESVTRFKITNNTGKAITSIAIKRGDQWGNDVLKDGVLPDGKSATITSTGTNECERDVRLTFKGDEKKWIVKGQNLCDLKSITLTLKDGQPTFKKD